MGIKIRAAFVATFVLILTACASLGLEPAATFGQRLAYAYSTHTAVLDSTTAALEIGDIQVDDAQRVLKVSDQARQALDAAKLAYGVGDVQTAEGRLQLAVALLTELQTYLRSKS